MNSVMVPIHEYLINYIFLVDEAWPTTGVRMTLHSALTQGFKGETGALFPVLSMHSHASDV
jgi:hypothetical protein